MDHLLLIDASGYAHRAYHGGLRTYRSEDGLPTWAILGFTRLLWSTLGAAEADKPTLAACVFDAPGKTFRHDLYPNYKAHRGERATELTVQIPYMVHAAETLGLKTLSATGFEADDVIATLAMQARMSGVRTTIVSSDKDFCQLVEDDRVEIVDPMAKKRFREADVTAKWGVRPLQFPDFQGLRGDDVDGIPGVPGCGDEKAAALIRRFGSLEEVLDNIAGCRWATIRAELKRRAGQARLSKTLATLRTDVPLALAVHELTTEPVERRHLVDFLKALDATGWLESVFGLSPQLLRVAPHVAKPFAWWAEELKHPGQAIPELPQAGFYERRLVAGGAFMPARIWREVELDLDTGLPTGNDYLMCEVDGRRRDPMAEWGRLAMRPVKRDTYDFEVADVAHAKRYRPTDPKANPHKPIDILAAPVSLNPKARRRRK
jgi:5'-3' exonuclease